jgi:hypothetical protein
MLWSSGFMDGGAQKAALAGNRPSFGKSSSLTLRIPGAANAWLGESAPNTAARHKPRQAKFTPSSCRTRTSPLGIA